MKPSFALAALFAAAILVTAADAPQAVKYIDHEKIATVLTKGGEITSGSDYRVAGVRRAAPGQVEVHDKETDIYYVTDGEATFITGGTMIGGKQTRPGQWLGKEIEGGETHHLTKGDVIVIPAGTPHWFKEIPQSVNYYMVKVIKP